MGGEFSASKRKMRAGAHLLLMATNPINRGILRTVLQRPIEVAPGEQYRVSPGGREMLFIAFVAERWLQSAPQGPLDFDSREAEGAIASLAEGWSVTVMHMLAREPLTLGELHDAIEGLSPRALRRHLDAMENSGLVEALPDGAGGAIYAATDWMRAGIAALIASARLERSNPKEGMAPIDALDVEAGFFCSLSLLELPKELSGTCRLGINLEEDESSCLTGVTARIEQGHITSCTAGLDKKADAWAAGSAGDWLDSVIEPDVNRVRTGGDRWLTRAVLDALHKTLFGVRVA